jgi:hypothetical protein
MLNCPSAMCPIYRQLEVKIAASDCCRINSNKADNSGYLCAIIGMWHLTASLQCHDNPSIKVID